MHLRIVGLFAALAFLASCSSTPEDEKHGLEDLGFTDVQMVTDDDKVRRSITDAIVTLGVCRNINLVFHSTGQVSGRSTNAWGYLSKSKGPQKAQFGPDSSSVTAAYMLTLDEFKLCATTPEEYEGFKRDLEQRGFKSVQLDVRGDSMEATIWVGTCRDITLSRIHFRGYLSPWAHNPTSDVAGAPKEGVDAAYLLSLPAFKRCRA